MADFSHYARVTASTVAHYIATGRKPTDEMFLEAIERIDPPLFSPTELEIVRRELVGTRTRRGVPKSEPLGARLEQISRPDIPAAFLIRLANRLQCRNVRFNERQREVSFLSEWARFQRKSIIRLFYRQIKRRLDGSQKVALPGFGLLDVPGDITTASDQALEMTRALTSQIGLYPPCIATLRNIVSDKSPKNS